MPDQEVLPAASMELKIHEGVRGIIPRTLPEAIEYALMVCKAELAPDSYKVGGNSADKEKPDQQKVVIGILKGLEVGLPPLAALANIAIINKVACLWGDAAVALVQSSGKITGQKTSWSGKEKINGPVETAHGEKDYSPTLADFTDDVTCIVEIWREGQDEPYRGEFSVRDAKRAHLWGNTKKVPWIEHPKRMLFNRARARAIRDGFADMLCGLAIREEIEDLPTAPAARPDISFLDDGPAKIDTTTRENGATLQIEAKTEVPFDAPKSAEPVTVQSPETAASPGASQATMAPVSGADSSPAEALPTTTPTPGEPPRCRSNKEVVVYATALIAWVPVASDADLGRHQKENQRAIEFIREHRPVDWQLYNESLDKRRLKP